MKTIQLHTVLPIHPRKIRAFFLTQGVLRLFYDVKSLEKTGHLSYLVNKKYNAIVYFSNTDIIWEVYSKNDKLRDKIKVFLYTVDDDTGVHLTFETTRILPLKRSLENEVNSGVELLKDLLDALRKY
ncbi:hypothetical protein HA72_2196 [Metallosphaera sedula]|uniref:Uncharacterized protein n=2 Tax=Metallosphaera sedula TaxID=43687 RepID=A4YIT3_METS5|nr:hypothetical protein [Metallosphaera sedula]ABP96335.1 hypothetical protein Msed_2196 [Metallosphaera sedula DSM 5348]AIM28318.1 hypothetical protein HA72_2196 [Metallosphaera sedula]AKV75118.1 hypothetical protein MsedA_2249 [Metallosphaera sedula]AKV77356.1 hypothetical protein MsedB_2251 [Metallosphaera sedula]AKV79607.1 hypothetical protein MsedC_2249 [Metallosphaera sedula]